MTLGPAPATAAGIVLLLTTVAACANGDGSDPTNAVAPIVVTEPPITSPTSSAASDALIDVRIGTIPATTPTEAPSSPAEDTVAANTTIAPATTSTFPEPTTSRPAAACGETPTVQPPDGPSVQLEEVATFDGGTVSAAEYPVPDDLGEPWSQWGQGVVLPDGRFVSGVGDHRGADGRSWFYEYDPATSALVQTTEVSEALGHRAGDWGYGKLHAPMVLDVCDRVVTATYWGSRRGLELGGSYSGDHLIRYDPASREVTSLGVPVTGYGLPSLSISPDRSTLYVEAVDPTSDPDAGVFLVVDALTGDVLHTDTSVDHIGFRDVLVTPEGDGLFASGNGLAGSSPTGAPISEDGVFGGESWFRSATPPADDGSVAISTRDPDALWIRDATGEFRDLGELDDYVAALALTSDGATAYFVPGAHGGGAKIGTPLVAADTRTGEQEVVVLLNDVIEPALGIRVGGSYNVAVDDANHRVYVGLNGGAADEEGAFGDVVLAVVEFD